jgi:predicted HicB family RNase H-like nuclease
MLVRATLFALAVLSIANSVTMASEGEESVAFRSKEWQSLHAEDDADAEKKLSMLRKLGCETKVNRHGNHSDVTFRSVQWREVTLESHENADRWEQWLNKNGFETLHGHAHASSRDAVAVQYMQSEWQSQHFEDEAKADEFVAICKGLGCEVRKGGHDGHIDVRFRCTSRRNLVCIDHDEAHSLQTWLEKKGFQTEHAH